MKVGIHAMVWKAEFDHPSLRHCIELAARTGYDFLELPLMQPEAVDGRYALKTAQQEGVSLTASLGLPPHKDVSSVDPGIRRAGVEHLMRAVDVAAEMGAQMLTGVIYSAMTKYQAPASAQAREASLDSLREVSDYALPTGVPLALEVVNRYESNIMNTAKEAVAYVKELNQPNVGIHLDTYHMNIEEESMDAPVREAGTHLAYVHVGESNRGALGRGTVDFATFFDALSAADYSGHVAFESFSSAVIAQDFCSQLAIWRETWADPQPVAEGAREVMARGLNVSPGRSTR